MVSIHYGIASPAPPQGGKRTNVLFLFLEDNLFPPLGGRGGDTEQKTILPLTGSGS